MEGPRIAAVTTAIVVLFGFLTSSGEYWQVAYIRCGLTEFIDRVKIALYDNILHTRKVSFQQKRQQ